MSEGIVLSIEILSESETAFKIKENTMDCIGFQTFVLLYTSRLCFKKVENLMNLCECNGFYLYPSNSQYGERKIIPRKFNDIIV